MKYSKDYSALFNYHIYIYIYITKAKQKTSNSPNTKKLTTLAKHKKPFCFRYQITVAFSAPFPSEKNIKLWTYNLN